MTPLLPTRRAFLATAAAAALPARAAADKPLLIDTHMHVWKGDAAFPFAHPYLKDYKAPKTAATVEILLKEMDASGVAACVLVQTINHGWDNRYTVHCVKAAPKRFRGHGLIDPTDPRVADKLDYWMREQGLAGMRFSPIYYEGKDDWLMSDAHKAMWKRAGQLGAVFNFFIATQQLPKLEQMVQRSPDVKVVIDHLARIDLKAADPLPEFKKLLALAKYPNVWCKVSELNIVSPSGTYPYKDTFPWLKRMFDAFGPDRLLWGTGFPGITRDEAGRPTLQAELDLIRKEVPFFTPADQAKILGRNAAKVWRFDV